MLTWGDYRTQIRRSILRDTRSSTWTDLELRDFVWWALDTFCAHTAVATSVTYTGVTGTTLDLPDNLFDNLEETGLVILRPSASTMQVVPSYLIPDSPANVLTYSVWPRDALVLSAAPGGEPSLEVDYFAYYNHPYADSDTIDVPQWAVPALSYLIGAIAMTGVGSVAANIGQWDDRTDSGQPENNPLRVQQTHLFKIYEIELSRHPRQERATFFKKRIPT